MMEKDESSRRPSPMRQQQQQQRPWDEDENFFHHSLKVTNFSARIENDEWYVYRSGIILAIQLSKIFDVDFFVRRFLGSASDTTSLSLVQLSRHVVVAAFLNILFLVFFHAQREREREWVNWEIRDPMDDGDEGSKK